MTKKRTAPPPASPASAYLPLARKYRPQTFEELIGQPHAATTLTRALESRRLGQAFLFAGQRGVGKTSAARILAKALNCATGPTPTPCRACDSCRAIETGNSLDVIEIDGASNRGIDDIRQLREQVKLAPIQGAFRVYIIDEVHQITSDAFNALLKTLEEPPPHVKFIFATTAPQKIPLTILSRCQRFDFRPVEAGAIAETLARIAEAEGLRAEDEALYALARAADGSLRDAEVLLEQVSTFCEGPVTAAAVRQVLGTLSGEVIAELADAIVAREARRTLEAVQAPLASGQEPLQVVLGLLAHLRNLVIVCAALGSGGARSSPDQLLDVSAEERRRLDEQAARTSTDDVLLILQLLLGAYELIRRSPVARTVLECAVLKAAMREAWVPLDRLAQELKQLSRGSPGPAAPMSPAVAPSVSAPRAAAGPSPSSRAPAAERRPEERAVPLAASAEPSAEVERLRRQWPQVLERLGERKMSLAAYLADSQPVAIDESDVEVGLPAFSLHQEVLSGAEAQRLIEQVLSDVIGARRSVRYTTLPEPAPGASDEGARTASLPPVVQDIVQLFNARVLDQPS